VSRAGMRLTAEAEADRDDFERDYHGGNCSCHLGFAPCGSCTHPGNPHNQDDDSCWEPDEDLPATGEGTRAAGWGIGIPRWLKVWLIKRKARKAYLTWREFGSDLDCGSHMAATLRPTRKLIADSAALEFDICLDKLAALGEQVPAMRMRDRK